MKTTLRLAIALILAIASVDCLEASRLNPVSWSATENGISSTPGSTVVVYLRAEVDNGYHLYSLTTPKGGPIPTSVTLASEPAIATYSVYQPKPDRHTDPTLGVPVETFEGVVDLPVIIHLSSKTTGEVAIKAQIRYQACSNEICLPPVTRSVGVSIQLRSGVPVNASLPGGYTLVGGHKMAPPVHEAATPLTAHFLFSAFGFGMLTLLTPCVFSSLPLTLAFLAGGAQYSRRRIIMKATFFSIGIVVLFVSIGLGVTALAGPFGAAHLAANPYVNLAVASVFILMGLSLVGAFELALPSRFLTAIDGATSGSSILATVLLGLTFCLTSFACIGPFLGTLLAASAQSGGWTPAIGTVAFATGLAVPIFLLAVFPAYVKKLPKSGPWLEQVKVISGFIILGLALKYAGAADSVAQWNVFTREDIIAAWFSLLLVLAFFLLGLVRLKYQSPTEGLSTGRLLAGVASLALCVSLLPGFLGGSVSGWDTLLPAAEISTAKAAATSEGSLWFKNDYAGALAEARVKGKPLLIAFSGYSCTNCHWMKANIFSKPEVGKALKNYVLVELYTDGTDAESTRNQKLELDRFGTIALPFYSIVDADEMRLASQDGIVRNPSDFLDFLRRT